MAEMKLYHVWFTDIDGHEDTLLFCVDDEGKQTVEKYMAERKTKGVAGEYDIADYVVCEADILSARGVLEYVKEKLEQ